MNLPTRSRALPLCHLARHIMCAQWKGPSAARSHYCLVPLQKIQRAKRLEEEEKQAVSRRAGVGFPLSEWFVLQNKRVDSVCWVEKWNAAVAAFVESSLLPGPLLQPAYGDKSPAPAAFGSLRVKVELTQYTILPTPDYE